MAEYPSKGTSLWVDSIPTTNYAPLKTDLQVDVAIIGGGIAGLTTAYLLKRAGKQVAVFEKNRIAQGISGFTTGKISSLHGTTYTSLIEKFDQETARIYGEANEAAIEQIEKIITDESIDCDWRREDNYVYTEKSDEVEKLQKEAANASSLGLPASFETEIPLPFGVKGAVRFSNQATFHVGKYLQALAERIDGDGCIVFEQTKATHVRDGSPCTFKVKNGTVTANEIVLATNIPAPLREHAAYAFLEHPTRSYIVAGKSKHPIDGMFISAGSPTRSILSVNIGSEQWLLVGGEGHFVGLSGPAENHYKKLAGYAKERFGIESIEYKWSTWDYVAYDHLPLIGKVYPFSKHLYTATGFRKWGMTNATVAGMILSDTLTGKRNPWAKTFRTNRSSALTSLPKGLIQGIFQ